ncbi:isocitrate lyase/PEP mutase family protein [Jatrophihabitans sp. YIM 134969]
MHAGASEFAEVSPSPALSGTSLGALLAAHHDRPLVVPGVGTPLEAHLAREAGFEALYQSGYAVAAWVHGVPDVGLVALAEMADSLARVTEAVPLPVICDADTGYGDVAGVRRTVLRLERAGAAAIQLEDQTWPKRCGHLTGKTVVPAVEHARKIRAAVDARRSPDTLVIARSDALAPLGMTETLERMKRYADAGADLLFVDAPSSLADLEAISAALPDLPLVANMSESGLTPHLSAADFHELGFAVVLYPTSALRLASRVVGEFFTELRAKGDSRGWADRMATLDDLNELVGLGATERFEQRVVDATPA